MRMMEGNRVKKGGVNASSEGRVTKIGVILRHRSGEQEGRSENNLSSLGSSLFTRGNGTTIRLRPTWEVICALVRNYSYLLDGGISEGKLTRKPNRC